MERLVHFIIPPVGILMDIESRHPFHGLYWNRVLNAVKFERFGIDFMLRNCVRPRGVDSVRPVTMRSSAGDGREIATFHDSL